ncbi:MAG: hypothetical protein IJA77_05180 [Clostridia bacterium]|nr:hypothetical protein [Clostridia bacterium]
MSFFTRFQMAMSRFMAGRNGTDLLGWHAMWGGIILMIANIFFRSPLLTLVYYVLYGYSIFRMLSRNIAKRQTENNRYTLFYEKVSREVKQFFLRLKGMKTYKYFRCPGCRNRLRMKRGSGLKHITCPVCRNQFDQKA